MFTPECCKVRLTTCFASPHPRGTLPPLSNTITFQFFLASFSISPFDSTSRGVHLVTGKHVLIPH